MKGVIAKDLYEFFGIRKNLMGFLSSYVFVMIQVAIGDSMLLPIVVSTVFVPFLLIPSPIQTTSMLDDKYDYPMYQITGPVTRKDVVNGKYLIGIIFMIFNNLLLTLFLLTRLHDTELKNLLLLSFISMIISLYSLAINYPSLMIFGIWGMIPMIISFAIGMIIYLVFPLSKIIKFFKGITAVNILYVLIISVIVALGLLLISYFVTQHFYNKKEFK
ncbi:hypothetical protein BG261_03230 [Floricoccus tropicus]|uniref:ABC-2 transporter permease n=1 Tax=Floricoccus tropicus TaxID=1859473 RepID=A0A1E8GQ47_9LACT|nr:ABC-2 transporter permease [Floricoccus tropicus]OFI49608.1 hypothetical protein BG261_03230 [Floricoccus tropicus]